MDADSRVLNVLTYEECTDKCTATTGCVAVTYYTKFYSSSSASRHPNIYIRYAATDTEITPTTIPILIPTSLPKKYQPSWVEEIGGKQSTNITIAYFIYIGSFFILDR